MRNFMKSIAGLAVMAMAVAPVYAALETVESAKSLADFQKQYAGTKPVVAFDKYREFNTLQKFPRPTLESSRIRTEVEVSDFSGTKPIVKFTMSHRPQRTSEAYIEPPYGSGTKPVIAYAKR